MRLLIPLLLAALPVLAAPPLVTVSEQSGFTRTGRYQEVVELCDAFAARYPKAVRCLDFGTTPQGRPMKALVASTSGALDPASARQRGLPVVLVQGGIHAGEIDGKDAGFLALRQVLEGEAAVAALDKLVLVFVPVFNVDGHERFGAWNRPNQRGPVEMGWRTTAQNYNLNRDYLKADAPEMQAMLALVNAWDPLAVVDLHATDGAQFEHDIAIQVEPVHAGPAALRAIGKQWRDGVIADLAEQGSLPLPFYPSFVVDDDPSSGFADSVAPPRFSTGYFWLRNRLSMLVETHSWRPYPERVRSTRNTVVSVLEHLAEHGQDWQRIVRDADVAASQPDTAPVPLAFAPGDAVRMIEFRGYAYTREPSDVSGALMTRYDESTPQVWTVPMRDDVQPSLSVPMPGAGYLVPAEHAAGVAAKLRVHGVAFRELADPGEFDVQAFRADSQALSAGSVEGHQTLAVNGTWAPERRTLGAGALFVPIRQPKSRLVMAMLEPQAPDSLLAWGAFNNQFERKEYMEAYVAEDVARDMLAKDPALRAEFQRRLADDAAFAANPSARLEFFYRRHPSWDAQLGLYPVLRVDTAPR
ncbi:MAG TPA: M14 family metallopeptidase [Arenimonas sp.]|uniref:M14 family metallopeptidase n=1 Tax=Arenimonas sp. TaxID=1872635 RepID=UPI002D809743|nr:M14 family metallopeptidase [Arenimonas sp.]HEU0153563.1 M14 family metallopeptidase [Arenimonas sp.]